MSILENAKLEKAAPVSKAVRKGAKYWARGKSVDSNPYTNPKRKEQFIFGWCEAASFAEWQGYAMDEELESG